MAAPLVAALLGIYIARAFATGPTTDAFFFANAIYGVVLFVGQSLRTTAITGLMVNGRLDQARLRAHVRAVALLGLVAACVFALLGVLILPALLSTQAQTTARLCLAIFWPASVLQLLGGLFAAALATHDDFHSSSLAYVLAAAVTLAAALGLGGSIGIEAVPAGLLIGSVISTAIMAWQLHCHIQADSPNPIRIERSSAPLLAAQLLLASAALIAPQIIISTTVLLAAHEGSGAATIMSYAQMAIVMLSAGLTSPVMTVYAPVVSREHRKDAGALMDLSDRAFRAGALVTPAAIAALALIAPPLANQLLARMTLHQINQIFLLAVIISPSLLFTQALMIPMLGVVTNERFAARAAATLSVAGVHVLLCLAAIDLAPHTLIGLALALVISSAGLALVDITLAFGAGAFIAVARTARATLTIVCPGAIAYGLGALVLPPAHQLTRGTLSFAAASVVYFLWLRAFHKYELLDLIHSLHPTRT